MRAIERLATTIMQKKVKKLAILKEPTQNTYDSLDLKKVWL
jgi:hypothetical protein